MSRHPSAMNQATPTKQQATGVCKKKLPNLGNKKPPIGQ